MDSIALRGFRCFQDTGDIPLKPLTLLIGENSSGKSSFLAATRLAWDAAYSQGHQLNFNEEPFLLGAYDQIAHYHGGRSGRATSFDVASSVQARPPRNHSSTSSGRIPLRFSTSLRQSGSHPIIERQSIDYAGHTLTIEFSAANQAPKVELRSEARTLVLPFRDLGHTRFTPGSPIDWGFFSFLVARRSEAEDSDSASKYKLTSAELSVLDAIGRETRTRRPERPIALAPVRSRPLRTYNPISATLSPEGDHIPMVLAKTFFEDKDRWEALQAALHQFGSESGLFEEVDIKALGRSESEPFQLRVKLEGPPANLIDVGYGVSQVLPILVDSILADRGETFLLQQPEVHLHPRAQAALGSFLIRLSVEQGKRFVVETHSDYLIDRIRTEIRDARIKPDDVSLLFFLRGKTEVSIHPMSVDETGNLLNVPTDYRAFFLDEERRLLGV